MILSFLTGKNLQICFVNDTASDVDSPSSDSESCPKLTKPKNNNGKINGLATNGHLKSIPSSITPPHPYNARPLTVKKSESIGKGKFRLLI